MFLQLVTKRNNDFIVVKLNSGYFELTTDNESKFHIKICLERIGMS